jgi:hypothetical protein
MPKIGSEIKGSVRVFPAVVEKPSIAEKPPMIVEKPSTIVEKPTIIVNATVGRPTILTSQENKTQIPRRDREIIPKPEKTVAPKMENNYSSKKDCLHQFGYLRTLPKNAPIPDECFGCQKLVQCLIRET